MSNQLRIDLDSDLNPKTKRLLAVLAEEQAIIENSDFFDREEPQEPEADRLHYEVPLPIFHQMLSALVGPAAATRILEFSQDPSVNILPYIAGVPNALLVDADAERTANTIADEARGHVYQMVKDMMPDEEDES